MVAKELERTSGSERGSSAVAVSGYMARGAGGDALPAPKLQTGGGGGSSLDYYAISARKAGLDISLGGAAKIWLADLGKAKKSGGERRVRRFYQRYFAGVGVGGTLRILTLTTSDEALASGKDIHQSWRALLMRLRRRYGHFEYIGVKEVKGGRVHLHLVFRGSYMEQVQLSAMWRAIHLSPVVDIRAVWSQRGGVRYLAKYLAKGAGNRYWVSYNWVFRGWIGWSKRVKRTFGHYPSKTILQTLARMTELRRIFTQEFLCPAMPVRISADPSFSYWCL